MALAKRGVLIRTLSRREAAEDAHVAYQDVDLVAHAIERAGLMRRIVLLRPRICL